MVNAWGTIPTRMCSANGKIWRRWHYNVELFFMEWFGPLVILHGNLNAEGYKDILTHCILSMVEDQLGDDDCLYQHDNAPCHKSVSLKEWFVDNNVTEMDRPAQSPDLNPTEHLWDELECRFTSRPKCPTSLTGLATTLQDGLPFCQRSSDTW
jgi:hypothetical protein